MAEVWKGRHAQLDYEVAVKFLKPQFAHDRDLQERFLNEGKRQANLDHPNIVRAIDFISDGGRHFLVMKYVEGGGLDRRIEEAGGPLPPEEVVSVSFQVLSALGYAHQQRVIHRDVKPSNILMDREGTCYLTDFGIALAAGQQRRTRTGTVMGTDYYMSPEQIRSPHTVDHRTDIYAFGVVLFEMLTGVVPFDYDNEFLLKQAHVEQAPPKPSKLNPTISKALESVVLRALAKNPDDRWGDCEAMIEALDLVRAGRRPPFRRTRPAGARTPAPPRPSTNRVPPSERLTPSPVSDIVQDDSSVARQRWNLGKLAAGILLVVALGIAVRMYFERSSATVSTNLRPHAQESPGKGNPRVQPPVQAQPPGEASPPALTRPDEPTPSSRTVPANPERSPAESPDKPPPGTHSTVPGPADPPQNEDKSEPPPPAINKKREPPPPVTPQESPQEQVFKPLPLPPKTPPEDRDEPPSKADILPKSVVPSPGNDVNPPVRNGAFPGPTVANSGRGPLSPTPERPPNLPPPVVTPPVLPPREPLSVPSSGTLIWSVQLRKNATETLTAMRPSSGQVHGDPLPGVPVQITISPTNAAGVVEPPSPANGWTTLRLRGLVNSTIVISIQWKRLNN